MVQLTLRHPAPPREIVFSGVIVDEDGNPAGGGAFLHDVDVGHDVANGSADCVGHFQVRSLCHQANPTSAIVCRSPMTP